MIETINQNILDFTSEQKYHAIISDPPYGLAFMNKGWDSFKKPIDYQKWVTDWSSHLMQFLYPGAVCAFFGGTRTYHRLASGLEDAGYEIFDSMIWCYGSGFPKSYNISKGIDKSLGLEQEIIGSFKATGTTRGKGAAGGYANGLIGLNGNNYEVVKDKINITKPNSNLATTWNGYGTALKPAYEPIVLCRKPLDKGGYVNSVLKYGTSGLNIDGGRIGNDSIISNGGNKFPNLYGEYKTNIESFHNGRFPANFGLICNCEKEPCECVQQELDNQSYKMGIHSAGNKRDATRQLPKSGNIFKLSGDGNRFGDSGGSSRFFYTAKASSKERELGLDELPKQFLANMGDGIGEREHNENEPSAFRHNNHPTVKPIKLIEYLALLLLPPIDNSSILIPFSGVGSEMIGAHLAGWQNITGVEIDEHYVEIANKRLDYWTQFEDYESAIKSKSNPQTSYEDTLQSK